MMEDRLAQHAVHDLARRPGFERLVCRDEPTSDGPNSEARHGYSTVRASSPEI